MTQLRFDPGRGVLRTQVERTPAAGQALADEWRQAFIGKGWRQQSAWTLRFGPSPAGLAWVVQREDGTGPTLVCAPDQYEEARHHLVRQALAGAVDAVLLTVNVVQGQPYVRREVLDR